MIGAEHRAKLEAAGRMEHFSRADVFCCQGDVSTHVMLIESGTVLVTTVVPTGVLAVRSAGQLVGEFSGLTAESRFAPVTALTDVRAIVIDAIRFRSIMRHSPAFTMAVLHSVISRVQEFDQRRLDFAAYQTRQRVAQVLFERACQQGIPIPDQPSWLLVKVSRQQLAGAAGTSRESVTRALGALEAGGAIQRYPRHLVVTSLALLEASSRHDLVAHK
jgi:CRP/FNR family transcriptional regulator, cyclic AMP receptor protein